MCILGVEKWVYPMLTEKWVGTPMCTLHYTTDIGVEQQILQVRKEQTNCPTVQKLSVILQNTTFPDLDNSICTFHDFPGYPMNVGTL